MFEHFKICLKKSKPSFLVKPVPPLVFMLINFSVYSQSDHSLHKLKGSKLENDSSYVYSLPYEKGKNHLLVQGYDSKLSHKGEIALDFKMKQGTKICAIREGTVTDMRADSEKGGLKGKYLSEGNYIVIRHADNSSAWYFHLQTNGVLVNVGDKIQGGQVIGLSGNSGYSAFPHLHLEVTCQDSLQFFQIPTRFQLRKGARYLRQGHFYRNTAQGKSQKNTAP